MDRRGWPAGPSRRLPCGARVISKMRAQRVASLVPLRALRFGLDAPVKHKHRSGSTVRKPYQRLLVGSFLSLMSGRLERMTGRGGATRTYSNQESMYFALEPGM